MFIFLIGIQSIQGHEQPLPGMELQDKEEQ